MKRVEASWISSVGVFFFFMCLPASRGKLIEAVTGPSPEFTSQIENVSIAIGRDATFTCHVQHLGSFKVGWVKADSKAIQAIHDNVITHNDRVQVSGDFVTTFSLHIRNVQEEDRGQYMCQINTDPMTYQTATLDVMVPPDIVYSSRDQELRVGGTAQLECRTEGYPTPQILWQREEKSDKIKAKDRHGVTQKYLRFEGSQLTIPNVTPDDMGAYLCIAKNNVPPMQSKRIFLYVEFTPMVKAQSMVGLYEDLESSLHCLVKAYPKPIIIWYHVDPNGNETMIVNNQDYELTENQLSQSQFSSTLMIRSASKDNAHVFKCVAKNSFGERHALTRTYLKPSPNRRSSHHYYKAKTTTPLPSSSLAVTETSRATQKEKEQKEWAKMFYSSLNNNDNSDLPQTKESESSSRRNRKSDRDVNTSRHHNSMLANGSCSNLVPSLGLLFQFHLFKLLRY